MEPGSRAIRVGERLPAIALRTASGEAVDLARWRGQPLIVVCVRYYG
jgi:hypothetical protein